VEEGRVAALRLVGVVEGTLEAATTEQEELAVADWVAAWVEEMEVAQAAGQA
jgi:hypothetical protein